MASTVLASSVIWPLVDVFLADADHQPAEDVVVGGAENCVSSRPRNVIDSSRSCFSGSSSQSRRSESSDEGVAWIIEPEANVRKRAVSERRRGFRPAAGNAERESRA